MVFYDVGSAYTAQNLLASLRITLLRVVYGSICKSFPYVRGVFFVFMFTIYGVVGSKQNICQYLSNGHLAIFFQVV